MNILLIEDEPKIADFVMEGFHALGWHSTHVLDGAAGLDALGRVRFDAIVLDWMLPTMDGMAFLARLRESDHACPVIMLTAKAELQDKLQGLPAQTLSFGGVDGPSQRAGPEAIRSGN